MTTPPTIIYVRPGWASYTWTYAGTSAVAFDASSALGQQLTRGELQYSTDSGKNWIPYTTPLDGQGAYIASAGTLWHFQDRSGADATTPNGFSAHYKMADGSIVTTDNTVVVDNSPASLTGHNDMLFSTLHSGDVVDTLAPVDSGSMTGGRWVIDNQSQPGLFSIAYNPAVDTAARLVLADSTQLPASGLSATVTVHYYDRYQLDTGSNPIAGQGVTRTLTYSVEDGVSHGLSNFTADLHLGGAMAATGTGAAPALAHLSTGGFVAVWQGADTVGGGAGAGIWAQQRDASGNALGAAYALTLNGNSQLEAEPAVTALTAGRFAVVYTSIDGGVAKIAYRVVEANGTVGAEHVVGSGAVGDAAMPSVTTLADGSFAVAWRAGGAVHVQGIGADGSLAGAVQDYAALGSAYSPSLAPLAQGGYVLSWGEMNDGNVYAATSIAHTPFMVSGDGYAASLSTAAPLPHVTALNGGGFVVSWDSYLHETHGFTISDIFFQRYDADAHAAGAVTQANVNSTGGLFDAALTGLSDGGFLVAWQGSDDDGNGIFGRRFGPDGTALDSQEFGISEQRIGDQASPDLTPLAGGGFAAAWLDTAADGSVSVEARVLPWIGVASASSVATASALGAAPVDSAVGAPPAAVPAPAPAPNVPTASAPAPGAVPSSPASSSTSASSAAPGAAVSVAKMVGSAADNVMDIPHGASLVDGGAGIDTLLASGLRSASIIARSDAGITVTDKAGDQATLLNVERIQFSDVTVGLDVNGNAGEAYRLYLAALNRTPDKTGLGFWIDALDKGHSLQEIAAGFTASEEFASLYGAHATDAQFVQALYQNVLHRSPDGSGYDFWMESLHSNSRGVVLAYFSESPENQAQVIGSIQNGIEFQHWG